MAGFGVFFFTDTAPTEIYTLSLHDALPIFGAVDGDVARHEVRASGRDGRLDRSEEHTSELQSHSDLVCRLLLEKKKTQRHHQHSRDMPRAADRTRGILATHSLGHRRDGQAR